MKKITITGTKGKTTVSSVLADVLAAIEDKVLRVDTSGAYVNGELAVSKIQSQLIWDLVPTVSPGRFLYLLADEGKYASHDDLPGVAVLEASLGCGTVSGLGYYGHSIGVFTNVYEDHLGSRKDLQTRADIGQSKKFIFSRINRNGTAVFNADDDIVTSLLHECKEGVKLLPFGVDFEHFDIKNHLKDGGYALTTQDDEIVLLHGKTKKKILNFKKVSWTFEGNYTPSIYNLLAVTGSLLALYEMELPAEILTALLESKLDNYSGRLTLLKSKDNVSVLADYAHETQSLNNIAQLAHKLKAADDNKVIGVLRLAWDRDEALIKDTAQQIAEAYDQFIIYDKIDGHWRQPSERFRTHQRQFTQEVGKISDQFSKALVDVRGADSVVRILREDEALQEASKRAKPGDVVVFIVNDHIPRSIDFAREYFKADFV